MHYHMYSMFRRISSNFFQQAEGPGWSFVVTAFQLSILMYFRWRKSEMDGSVDV